MPTLVVKKLSESHRHVTDEERYWKGLKQTITTKEFTGINAISFSKTEPFEIAATSSSKVVVYGANGSSSKTFAKFKDNAYSGCLREDGKLLVAGDERGVVQVFDMKTKAILRSFKEHSAAVRLTKFSCINTQILSGSDDKSLRLWDVPTQKRLNIFQGHKDYVRCGLVCSDDPNMILSGSYDHSVKLWDARAQALVMDIDHGDPVESLLLFPGGRLAVSCGSNVMKIWDVAAGGRLLHSVSNHQKTITSLAFNDDYSRILSGSLDHHVKVYDIKDYSVSFSFRNPAPVLSIGLSMDNSCLAVGMANGLLSIRKRNETIKESSKLAEKSKEESEIYDYVVKVDRYKKLKPFDKHLNRFQYTLALDTALATNDRKIIYSLLEEIIHRGGLTQAIANRDEEALEPLLKFIMRNLTNSNFSKLLLKVADMLIDIYSPIFGQSKRIDHLFFEIRRVVLQEIELQQGLIKLCSAIELVLASSASSRNARHS